MTNQNFTAPDLHSLNFGVNNNGQTIATLYKTHYLYNGIKCEFSEPNLLKFWDINGLTQDMINEEAILNDWSRFNTELKDGQKVQISENIYYDLLGCLPPKNWNGNYFEVGEAHHHTNKGKAIHRACWIENGLYYTGYPKTNI